MRSKLSRRALLEGMLASAALSASIAKCALAETSSLEATAEEAYIWGLPLWLQEKYLERARHNGMAPNRFCLSMQLARPEDRNIGPNVDTLYGYAWLDLKAEPLSLHVPDTNDRYYCIQFIDAYSNSFAYVGRRVTGTKEGHYIIAGPNWKGHVPNGTALINAPTNRVLALARTLVRSETDLPAARAIQEKYRLTPLSRVDKPAPNSVHVVSAIGTFPFLHPGKQGASFFDDFGRYLQSDPPPPRENAPLQRFSEAKILAGIRPSASSNRSQYEHAVATADERVAAANYSTKVNGWKVNYGVTPFIADRLQRAAANRLGPGVHVAEEALYFGATTDSTQNLLTGKKKYRIRFAAGRLPPVDAFWSLILYGADFFLYANFLNRYSISDRTEGLAHEPDGALHIRLQHEKPESAVRNWLPAPAGNFQLVLRTYQPKPEVLQQKWKPPFIEEI